MVKLSMRAVWKSMPVLLKRHNLPTSEWEQVMSEALHSIRSLVHTTTNETLINASLVSQENRRVVHQLRHGSNWGNQFCPEIQSTK